MEIYSALFSLINIIKQATQAATPTPKINLQNKTRNVPIEIKKLIAEKRRARAREEQGGTEVKHQQIKQLIIT
jgi:hypothetical protein